MVAFEFENVEIDRCVACGGTWLDSGELGRILEQGGADPEAWRRALENARVDRKTRRRCPRCPRRLQEIHVGTEPSVTLDRCPWGDGLWFDRGEMETVVRSHTAGQEGVVGRFFADLFHSEFQTDKGD
jgi:Zn-finger nucleic acid-binding protein